MINENTNNEPGALLFVIMFCGFEDKTVCKM